MIREQRLDYIETQYAHLMDQQRDLSFLVPELLSEVRQLRKTLLEVMAPIDTLTTTYELSDEIREELNAMRTLGRTALFGVPTFLT